METSRLKREVSDLRARGGSADRMVGSSSADLEPQADHRKARTSQFEDSDIGAPDGQGWPPVNSRKFGARQRCLCRHQHADNVARENGSGTVRRRIRRRRAGEGRCARRGARRYALPGRNCRHAARTQAKILRVLVDQNFQRVGGASRVSVDVRIISSTSRDLAEAITEGRFREDLFHRLSVVPVRVPSLAERREDIPELVQYFSKSVAANMGVPPRRVGSDAMAVLESHDWPGNIRQLRNNVERLMILALGDPNARSRPRCFRRKWRARAGRAERHWRREIAEPSASRGARSFERDYLVAQISRFGGNISRTAEFIGMERSALHRKLKSLGVE